MALRNILTQGDASLKKTSRRIEKFDDRLHRLLDDMRDTLYEANGVGLAAPQVGVLRRAILVLDENEQVMELLNPEIIAAEGQQDGLEGCLSVPGQYGMVVRPMKVTVRAQDRNGAACEVTGEGLTARCLCHEIDHLDGHLYTEIAHEMLTPEQVEEMIRQEEEGK